MTPTLAAHRVRLARKANALEKTLMLGKTEGMRQRGLQRMRWLDGISNLTHMSLSKLRVLFLHGLESNPESSLQTEEEG